MQALALSALNEKSTKEIFEQTPRLTPSLARYLPLSRTFLGNTHSLFQFLQLLLLSLNPPLELRKWALSLRTTKGVVRTKRVLSTIDVPT